MLLPSRAHPTRALSSWLLGTGTGIPLTALGFSPIDPHTGTEVPSLAVGKDGGSEETESAVLDVPGLSSIAPAHPKLSEKGNRSSPS